MVQVESAFSIILTPARVTPSNRKSLPGTGSSAATHCGFHLARKSLISLKDSLRPM